MTRGVAGPDRQAGAVPGGVRPESVDLYEVLQVSPRASKEVIHAAYRVLVRSYHPDTNGASPEVDHRIRQLNAAYRILSDPEGRARYDLESARWRRSERLTHLAKPAIPPPTTYGRSREIARAAALRDERPAPLSGQVVLGLFAVIAVVVIMIMLLWATVDSDPNDQLVIHPGQSGELIRH